MGLKKKINNLVKALVLVMSSFLN